MSAIGLVAEGEYDIAVLKVLIVNILGHQVQIAHRFGPGQGGVVRWFPSLLSDISEETQINKAIVVVDLGRRSQLSSGQLKSQMQARIPPQFSFQVHAVVVVRELEAWLLADELALSQMTRQTVPTFSNPESIPNPKTELTKILAQTNPEIPYTAGIARSIAEKIRLDILWNRCNSFREFKAAVLAP